MAIREVPGAMFTPREHAGVLLLASAIALLIVVPCAADEVATPKAGVVKEAESGEPEYTTEKLRGKVVWLDEALKRLRNITSEPDAEKTQVVLEMADGTLWPLVPDTRGRSFLLDERLRDVEFELLVRRYDKVPFLQVIRIRKPTDQGLVEVDYWCDICAIPMYTLKPCECCQGETRLRERPLDEVFEP
jgi:hypothetical protein